MTYKIQYDKETELMLRKTGFAMDNIIFESWYPVLFTAKIIDERNKKNRKELFIFMNHRRDGKKVEWLVSKVDNVWNILSFLHNQTTYFDLMENSSFKFIILIKQGSKKVEKRKVETFEGIYENGKNEYFDAEIDEVYEDILHYRVNWLY